MRPTDVQYRANTWWGVPLMLMVSGVCVLQGCGILHGDYAPTLSVRGKLLDSETLDGATDAALGGRTFTDGEETAFVTPLTSFGDLNVPAPEEDGAFRISFRGVMGPSSRDRREFPRPDRIEVIVVRGDCEQTFSIDINEDTVVDMTFPDDTTELKDPILVDPCEE